MKYFVKHCDGCRRVIMKETVESDEPVEYLLRQYCRKSISLVEMCLKRLHEEDPEIGNSTNNRYRITGNEGIVYSIVNGEEWISDIHICTPVGRGIPWKLRDPLNGAKKRLALTLGTLTYNSMNSPILFRWWDEWWDELPLSGIEKNKVFSRERLFDSPGRGIIISAAATIQSKQERC